MEKIQLSLKGNDSQGDKEIHRAPEEQWTSDSTHGISCKRQDVN